MNRIAVSPTCLVCGIDMLGQYKASAVVATRNDLQRQMQSGICDACQRARHNAALTLIHAADEVRVIWELFVAAGRPTGNGRDPFTEGSTHHPTMQRVIHAERRCVDLKMWPSVRTDRIPERFTNKVSSWWLPQATAPRPRR